MCPTPKPRRAADAEATRLENLWAGTFGDAYIERNSNAGAEREAFWLRTVEKLNPQRVLEVGCNIGGNLRHIARQVGPRNVFGVDINETSLEKLRSTVQGVNANWARAQDLPFRDGWFDLVLTVGVLIHQPDSTVVAVIEEIHRCSRRYILCAEYFAERAEEVAYRGERGALFRRDYSALYLDNFSDLRVMHEEILGSDDGFDDVRCTILEKVR